MTVPLKMAYFSIVLYDVTFLVLPTEGATNTVIKSLSLKIHFGHSFRPEPRYNLLCSNSFKTYINKTKTYIYTFILKHIPAGVFHTFK